MPSIIPGVETRVIDISPTLGSRTNQLVYAMIGQFGRGRSDAPTLIASQDDLEKYLGNIDEARTPLDVVSLDKCLAYASGVYVVNVWKNALFGGIGIKSDSLVPLPHGLTADATFNFTAFEVVDEVLDTGDGVTTIFGPLQTDGIDTLASSMTLTFMIGSVEYTETDDGLGEFTNDNAKISYSYIDYANGIIYVTFVTAPDDETDILLSYTYDTNFLAVLINKSQGDSFEKFGIAIKNVNTTNNTFDVYEYELVGGVANLVNTMTVSRDSTKKNNYGENIFIENVFESKSFIFNAFNNSSIVNTVLPTGDQPAFEVGSVNLSAGHNWAAVNQTFNIAINGDTVKLVTLNANCANVAAIVSHITARLVIAGITNVIAYASGNYVGIKTVAVGSGQSFILSVGTVDALATIGWGVATYTGTDSAISYSAGGTDGDAVTTVEQSTAIGLFGNTQWNFSKFVGCGIKDATLVAAIDEMCTARKKIAFLDVTIPTVVANYINSIDSKYLMFFTPDAYAAYRGVKYLIPASAFVAYKYGQFYSNSPYMPPAGPERGTINVIELYRYYNDVERLHLHEQRINTIAFMETYGNLISTDFTSQTLETATSYFNAVETLNYIESTLKDALFSGTYKVINAVTISRLKRQIEVFLDGLSRFDGTIDSNYIDVVCDGRNNNETTRDAGEIKIAIVIVFQNLARKIKLDIIYTTAGNFSFVVSEI